MILTTIEHGTYACLGLAQFDRNLNSKDPLFLISTNKSICTEWGRNTNQNLAQYSKEEIASGKPMRQFIVKPK